MDNWLEQLLIWSGIGIILFSLFVIVVFRTGIVWDSRDETGILEKDIKPTGLLSMLIVLIGIISLQIAFDFSAFGRRDIWTLGEILRSNFILFLILFLYDTLVVDYVVIGIWRPKFLKLPSQMNMNSMQKHILISIPIGLIVGFIISFISSALFYNFIL